MGEAKLPPLADAHCHLQDEAFAADLPDVLRRVEERGVRTLLVNSTRPADWDRVAALAETYPQIFPTFGIHPWFISDRRKSDEQRLRELLLRFPRAGVGEIGLDTHGASADEEAQAECLLWQLECARDLNRSCSLHIQGGWNRAAELLVQSGAPRFLLHGFTGSRELVDRFTDLGGYFSVGAAVLRDNLSAKTREGMRHIPVERLLVETDSPHVHSGTKEARQLPSAIPEILRALAALREMDPGVLATCCAENLQAFLGEV